MSSIHKNNIGLMASAGRILLLGMLTVCPPVNVSASGPGSPQNVPEDPTVLSLEDLMNISVAKRPQKVADSAAAVFVITQEDMHRSGATSIPEALRMVPVDGARASLRTSAVARGARSHRRPKRLHASFLGRLLERTGCCARRCGPHRSYPWARGDPMGR